MIASVNTKPTLRSGWTTGSCATAAAKSATTALLTGHFPDPVEITLPRGQRVAFALAETSLTETTAMAAIVKDAGDDPDVTHGALIQSRVWRGPPGSGVTFRAGEGVGTVTRAGLPIPPGEPAINPTPRAMITAAITEVTQAYGAPADFVVEIAIPGGEKLAETTLNGRLGITGGLSILGTTGIVIPFSCAAWIDSIHRGIDVARAANLPHIAGATGRNSEQSVQRFHTLPDMALIEMGDFVGGMLKYLRTHPIPRITIAGGIGKITKLAQGRLDLHSKRGAVDLQALAAVAARIGTSAEACARIATANTTPEAFTLAPGLGHAIARQARQTAADVLDNPAMQLEILIFDSTGQTVGHADFAPAQGRNLRR